MPKPGKRPKAPPFVMLPWHLLNSSAYRSLPPSAAKALPFFLGKPHISPANSALFEAVFSFPYQEARRVLGFGTSTFFKVISDLVKFGFIDPVTKGGLRGNRLSCNEFKVSRRWKSYGTDNFKEVRWGEFV